MNKDDLERTLILTIQDFCSKNGYSNDKIEFSLNSATDFSAAIIKNKLNLSTVNNILKKHNYFLRKNLLTIKDVSLEMLKYLKNNLVYSVCSFEEMIEEFINNVESTSYKAFDKKNPKEEIGRSFFELFSKGYGYTSYREPELAGGKCDLLFPEQEKIIEFKIWKSEEYFLSGIDEIKAYLKSKKWNDGYYIIFYNTNSDFINKQKEIKNLQKNYGNIKINIYFVNIKPTPPSKIRKVDNGKH